MCVDIMKITNRKNLPSAFVNMAEEQRQIIKGYYSVTTLLNPVREILLKRKYDKMIEQDVSDMAWLFLGTAVHHFLEKHNKEGFAEISMEQNILPNYYLTGKCDLYSREKCLIVDYKTASVWKWMFGDFEDWKKQGMMYAWLLYKRGEFVERMQFIAILKDWTARDKRSKGDEYPDCPIQVWEYKITPKDFADIEKFIFEKFNLIDKCIKSGKLPYCTEEERWNSGSKFAVMKKNHKRATRVFDTEEEAKNYIANKEGDFIEKRPGEDRKCQDYCLAVEYCKKLKEREEK